jgi:hypothetical protein
LEGRAQGGMADCLKGWFAAEAAGLPHYVESAESVWLRLYNRPRKARTNHTANSTAAPKRRIRRSLKHGNNYPTAAPIEAAIQQLAEMIADHEDAIRVA